MAENQQDLETQRALRHYYRGKVYDIIGEIDLAIEEHLNAIRLGAHFADVHNSLGKLYMKKQLYTEAKDEFRKALALNPYYSDAQINLEEAQRLEKLTRKPPPPPPPPQPTEMKKETIETIQPKVLVLPKKTYFIISAVIPLFIGLLLIVKSVLFKEADLKIYTSPIDTISSFCLDRKNIYLADWKEKTIYLCEVKNNQIKIKNKIRLTVYPSFVTISKNSFFILDALENKLNYYSLNETLVLEKSKYFLPIYPSNIIVSEKKLWTVDLLSNNLYEISLHDLKILNSYNLIKTKIVKILWDGADLYIFDEYNSLYMLDKKERDKISKKYLLSLPANRKISNIYLTKKHIWIYFEGESNLYRLSRKNYLF